MRERGGEGERDTADLENFCVYQQCPDYLKIIANPMDIGTVSARLSAGAYVTATGTQFTRSTSTRVQILTQKTLLRPGRRALVCRCETDV